MGRLIGNTRRDSLWSAFGTRRPAVHTGGASRTPQGSLPPLLPPGLGPVCVPGNPCPRTCERDGDGTTKLRNAHDTEVVVCYPWHPWYRLSVDIKCAVTKRPEPVIRVTRMEHGALRLREIPFWMTDPGACAVMKPGERPVVDCAALRALRDLLEIAITGHQEHVVGNQHLGSQSKGGADAKAPWSPPSRSVGDASRPVICTPLADVTAGDQAADPPATGASVEGALCRPSRGQRGKGGVR